MSAEITCLRFLNAVAAKMANLYEFDLDDFQHPTFSDVLRALENKSWSHRKIPRTSKTLDEAFDERQWDVLKKLNDTVRDCFHDALLFRAEKGNPFITLPSRMYFDHSECRSLREVAECTELVRCASDLMIQRQ